MKRLTTEERHASIEAFLAGLLIAASIVMFALTYGR